MKPFIFFGGRELGYRCLETLLSKNLYPALLVLNPEDKEEDLNHSLIPVVKKYDIPFISFKELTSKSIQIRIQEINPHVGFSAFCSRIIPSETLKLFTKGISNIHFSRLPKYRGQFPTVHAIANGDQKTAVTLHWINQNIDEGELILRKEIDIDFDETGKSLFEKCLLSGVALFEKQLDFLEEDQWPKGESLSEYNSIENPNQTELPNQGNINWDWSKTEIEKFICAMSYPPSHGLEFKIGKRKFKISELED